MMRTLTEIEQREIEHVVSRLAPKFVFGYYDQDDIRQQAYLFAMECLDRYDPQKSSLKTFLYTHVRNRLINLKRELEEKSYTPCQCANACKKCQRRQRVNSTRRELLNLNSIHDLLNEHESSLVFHSRPEHEVEFGELQQWINDNLPINIRADYLKLIDCVPLSRFARDRVRREIIKIIERYNADKISSG